MQKEDCHFVVIGPGTEYPRLQAWYNDNTCYNVTLLKGLPKEEYDQFVQACDVGLFFLDHRFSIPNFPSRLLSYLENKMPVLCATDPNTDMGQDRRAEWLWLLVREQFGGGVYIHRGQDDSRRQKSDGREGI